jgi:hypothetical protein
VLLKVPRKLLTLRSLQTCQGSGVGSIPIGRSILFFAFTVDCYRANLKPSVPNSYRSCSSKT